MIKAFQNAKLIVLAIFLVVTAGMWTYEIFYGLPKERCEKAGAWWSMRYRACGVPVDVSSFTGRSHPAVPPATVLATPAPAPGGH